VVRSRFPAVDAALQLLGRCGLRHGPARMSGSGSAVFCELASAADAQTVLDRVRGEMPAGWSAWAVAGLAGLPLAEW
jgi:4-diphosphocytidyl-2-C-methyl-D-erythritol kinase